VRASFAFGKLQEVKRLKPRENDCLNQQPWK